MQFNQHHISTTSSRFRAKPSGNANGLCDGLDKELDKISYTLGLKNIWHLYVQDFNPLDETN